MQALRSPLASLLASFVAGIVLPSCGGHDATSPATSNETPAERQAPAEEPPPRATFDHPVSPHQPSGEQPDKALFFRMPGEEAVRYATWESEETINSILRAMKRKEGSCEITFTPGFYEIDHRIFVNQVSDLTISGMPGTYLYFKDGEDKTTSTAKALQEGDLTMEVLDAGRIEDGRRYQIYREDGRLDRLLEFEVLSVLDGLVHLANEVYFMPHVKEIPAGSWVMEELTFFRVSESPNCTIQGFTVDGLGRGGIRGHTIYCGVHANGNYKLGRKPIHNGLTIRNCTFKNLKGRGVVWYGLGNVLVENNAFYEIRAQAVEIDHQSHGIVRGNTIDGAEIGVMVNDAFDSLVEGNLIRNCQLGVRFLAIVKNDFTNRGNIVRRNIIGPDCNAGVVFFNDGMTGNEVTDNRFIGIAKGAQIINPGENKVQ